MNQTLRDYTKTPLSRGRGVGGESFIFNGLCFQKLYKNAS